MYNDLDIGVLGFGPQGSKISNLVFNKYKKKILVYSSKSNLDKKKFIPTKNIKDLKICKLVFICSPNFSHYKYLNYYKDTAKFIFCEKPPLNKIEEYLKLKNFEKKYKKKIYFNFNYLFSEQYKILKKKISSNIYGKLIDINICICNGISFKKKLNNSWRSKNNDIFSSIIGNLGIHYINLIDDLLGDIKIQKINFSRVGKFKLPDTVSILINSKKDIYSRVFLTYASPFYQNIRLTFTNAILEIYNGKIELYFPRDTFDKNKRYIQPKKKILYQKKTSSIWDDTMVKSVDYFLNKTSKNSYFSERIFEKNLNQAKMLLDKINEKN